MPAKPLPRATITRATKSKQDGQTVTSLVVAFALVVALTATLRIRGSVRRANSESAVASTLKELHEKQTTFRTLNQRFATWRELEAGGMRLPAQQSLVTSNATSSHWFASVRDRTTGVICDKTGELMDEGPGEHQPVCRSPDE